MPLHVQAVETGEAPQGERAILPVQDVRIELWRYDYSAPTCRLQGRKILEATGRKGGDA
jgi:hypothetical protein